MVLLLSRRRGRRRRLLSDMCRIPRQPTVVGEHSRTGGGHGSAPAPYPRPAARRRPPARGRAPGGGAERHRGRRRRLRELARVEVRVPVPGVDDEVVADIAGRFLADGTVGAIEGWLERPELGVEDFMRMYVRLVPDWWPRDLA